MSVDKEKVYQEQILPHITAIYNICKEHDIAFSGIWEVSPTDVYVTQSPTKSQEDMSDVTRLICIINQDPEYAQAVISLIKAIPIHLLKLALSDKDPPNAIQ